MHCSLGFVWLASFLPELIGSTRASQTTLQAIDELPVVHFTLARRGGTFEATIPGNDTLELDFLLEHLENVEARFNFTRREVRGNKLVRKAKSRAIGGKDEDELMGELAINGTWFARLTLGEPPQSIDLDLNMLTSDFYVRHTSSHAGTRYDDLFSESFLKSKEHPHRSCTLPTDVFHLPSVGKQFPLPFAYCRPLRAARETLEASGSMLGLAPSKHLRQIDTPFLVHQLLGKGIVKRPVASLMLLSGHDGVLSIGGTGAKAAEMADRRTAAELDRAGAQEKIDAFIQENGKTLEGGTNSLDKDKARVFEEKTNLHRRESPAGSDWVEDWTWTSVQGAEGWWQTLMQGVWVGGRRILQNQAVVIDINTPFILAPPVAAKTFYASVAGSRQLDPPYSNFYSFPCMDPPSIDFEFSGTRFQAMRGGRGMEYNSAIIPGGAFSLGRMQHGGGYCIGAIVETRMGLLDEKEGMTGSGKQGIGSAAASMGSLAGNGMRDVWVIGEPFFRGVLGAFDFQEKMIGFRKY